MRSNFEFLSRYWPEIAEIGMTAEACFYTSPQMCITKLWALAQRIVWLMIDYENISVPAELNTEERIKILRREGHAVKQAAVIFRQAHRFRPDRLQLLRQGSILQKTEKEGTRQNHRAPENQLCIFGGKGKNSDRLLYLEDQLIGAVQRLDGFHHDGIFLIVILCGGDLVAKDHIGTADHAVGGAAVGPLGPHAVGIIGVADSIGAVAGAGQSATLCPCECPTVTVVVAGGIAHGIVGDTLAINRSQQVLPARIPIGVGMPIAGQDVAHSIVGVRIGRRTIYRTEKLVLCVIGIGHRSVAVETSNR